MSCLDASLTDKFEETSLPQPEAFYSSLTNAAIDDESHERLQKIWSEFQCQTLGDFVYLELNVILLCAVFENFRQTSLDELKLDLVHFYSTPGLTWAAALRVTRQVLSPIPDMNTLLFIEKGIRGGMTCVSERYAKANNPMCPDYNPAHPNTWIAYFDVNCMDGLSHSLYHTISVECLITKNSLPSLRIYWGISCTKRQQF